MSNSCNPMGCSPPGSSVHGILQVRILESVAIYFSRGSSQPRSQTRVSCIAGRIFTDWAMTEAAWHVEMPSKFAFQQVCCWFVGALLWDMGFNALLRWYKHTVCCCCLVAKSCPTLLQSHELWPARHQV